MVTRGFVGRSASSDLSTRLPRGQHVVTDFPVLSAGPTPRISTEDWTFTLKVGVGLVKFGAGPNSTRCRRAR